MEAPTLLLFLLHLLSRGGGDSGANGAALGSRTDDGGDGSGMEPNEEGFGITGGIGLVLLMFLLEDQCYLGWDLRAGLGLSSCWFDFLFAGSLGHSRNGG